MPTSATSRTRNGVAREPNQRQSLDFQRLDAPRGARPYGLAAQLNAATRVLNVFANGIRDFANDMPTL
jgi:hypothetical protein